MIEASEKLKSTAEDKASRMADSPVLSNNPTVFYLLMHSSSRTRSAALVSPNLFSSAALCLQSELLFLIMNFFQVLNRKNGIHRVKNHIVAFHCPGGGLLINLRTVLTGIIMPITGFS